MKVQLGNPPHDYDLVLDIDEPVNNYLDNMSTKSKLHNLHRF